MSSLWGHHDIKVRHREVLSVGLSTSSLMDIILLSYPIDFAILFLSSLELSGTTESRHESCMFHAMSPALSLMGFFLRPCPCRDGFSGESLLLCLFLPA